MGVRNGKIVFAAVCTIGLLIASAGDAAALGGGLLD